MNPAAERPAFDLAFPFRDLQLTRLNDFLKACALFDVRDGTISIFGGPQAGDGKFKGYVKPLIRDVEVLSPEEEAEKGFFAAAWPAAVEMMRNASIETLKQGLEGKPAPGEWQTPPAACLPPGGSMPAITDRTVILALLFFLSQGLSGTGPGR